MSEHFIAMGPRYKPSQSTFERFSCKGLYKNIVYYYYYVYFHSPGFISVTVLIACFNKLYIFIY